MTPLSTAAVIDEAIPPADAEAIEQEIAELERRLAKAKAKRRPAGAYLNSSHDADAYTSKQTIGPNEVPATTTHFLLLLSDSALPLGSFAFSSGLESYLSHCKLAPLTNPNPNPPSLSAFLPLSLSSYAATTLPFTLSAHRDPSRLASLDDALDATMICTVGRRASVAQGRALLSIWERSFSASLPAEAEETLRPFLSLLRQPSPAGSLPGVSAHLAPLFGALARLAGLSLEQTAYVFLLGHVKALVSAAVRAGMFGPYQAQKTLAGPAVQELIAAMVAREWDTPVERAGQSVPVMDLWVGRHELLYSRIFNS
ncbi:hypothetical protein B0T19DRAFT_442313 [Cercophora scortea]|uniref:Urease accessory protein UreF n=1 Tax=Cercophora scortea TaxID=314031 RepID=A0AAE0MDH1_9PEZI|nr:hypothetical protein B0T19DRAFT_442313 [Cercophora scortea]